MEARYNKDRVLPALEQVGMPAVASRLAIEWKQIGRVFWAPCPFHAERSASFKMEARGRHGEWRYHCFGCGVGGGIINLWMEHQQVDFPTALAELAVVAGVGPEVEGSRPVVVRKVEVKPAPERKIVLPPLRRLSAQTAAELAALRGVSVEAVVAAGRDGLVWGGMFGLTKRRRADGTENNTGLAWGERLEWAVKNDMVWSGPHRCWVVSDGHQCAAVRRLDGGEWPRWDKEDRPFKSYSVGTKKWPMGVRRIGDKPAVAIVEGEADLLAAYHFALACGRLHDVAPVAILGAASSMPEEVWPLFRGKQVAMFPHYDKPDDKGRRTGWEAAGKWESALLAAGAACVETFWFGTDEENRLLMADGKPVKDLNDAARGDVDTLAALHAFWSKPWSKWELRKPWENGKVGAPGRLKV